MSWHLYGLCQKVLPTKACYLNWQNPIKEIYKESSMINRSRTKSLCEDYKIKKVIEDDLLQIVTTQAI